MYKKVGIVLLLVLGCTSLLAQERMFSEKIGKLMELVTEHSVDAEQVKAVLMSLDIDGKEMQTAAMDYSIYDKFEGDVMYYIPYKTAKESRFSVEQLKQEGKLFYTLQFLLNSEYVKEKDNEVRYSDPAYKYNTTLEQLMPYCTVPMKYKNGNGNNPNSPLLSCIYTNPKSNRKLMYWVVCEDNIGSQKGNQIKEIKIQSQELWR